MANSDDGLSTRDFTTNPNEDLSLLDKQAFQLPHVPEDLLELAVLRDFLLGDEGAAQKPGPPKERKVKNRIMASIEELEQLRAAEEAQEQLLRQQGGEKAAEEHMLREHEEKRIAWQQKLHDQHTAIVAQLQVIERYKEFMASCPTTGPEAEPLRVMREAVLENVNGFVHMHRTGEEGDKPIDRMTRLSGKKSEWGAALNWMKAFFAATDVGVMPEEDTPPAPGKVVGGSGGTVREQAAQSESS